MTNSEEHDAMAGIAIVGMAGRFSKANNIEEFWRNLCEGKETISFFTDEECLASGEAPELVRNPNYVKAGGLIDGLDQFDASFFDFNPREAEVTDPQQRIFLECAWEAIEDANCDPERFNGRIGVYAGIGDNQYFARIPPETRLFTDEMTIGIGNEKDYVATRVCYKINLKSAGVTVQSACSTSLVAVHLACQSLLNYQSDMALAGGVSLDLHKKGNLYSNGGILSPDGHCRTFDAKANGTIWSSGVGVVVLQRLADAIADGNRIYAVIKGAAINNDGAVKIGFSAPSMEGQAAVIAEAIELAGVNPETISYVEAHGTATSLGDPIEVAGLTKAFRCYTDRKGFCRIGSVKTNIGHANIAAGVAGLIKTALSIHHKKIPSSLHFEKPNPQIDFENSPFFVNTSLVDWPAGPAPRRAGVSSFGIGGTNAHIILEEAPPLIKSEPSRPWQLLLISARTETALATATANVASFLKSAVDVDLADVAYTLKVGRKEFEYRHSLVCRDAQDAITALEEREPRRLIRGNPESENHPIVFVFPGQGTQYVNMGRELYELEKTFREQVDYCSEILKPELGLDLREILYPEPERAEEAAKELTQTKFTQPALFVIEYALSKIWMEWGIIPESMIGHSIGEYVAACLAGVFSVEDALRLVAVRGRLIQGMEPGAMLAVSTPAKQVKSLLGKNLSLAAINAPLLCVLSGGHKEVDAVERRLKEKGEITRRLYTSHAFHSAMMEPALQQYREALQRVKLNPPAIPYISNLTGTWIQGAQATSPDYWVAHLRQPVQFSDGVTELLEDSARIFLEIGPGQTLLNLVKQHPDQATDRVMTASMRRPNDQIPDQEFLLGAMGRLWASGIQVDWAKFYEGERRLRVSLPKYPFEHKRYWVEGGKTASKSFAHWVPLGKRSDIADWFYLPSWKRSLPPTLFIEHEGEETPSRWLIFMDDYGLGLRMADKLRERGQDVTGVIAGEKFAWIDDRIITINPRNQSDYLTLLKEICETGKTPTRIAYLWSVNRCADWEEIQTLNFDGLLSLSIAIGAQGVNDQIQIEVVSSGAHDVTGQEELQFEKSILLGPCRVIPQEYSNISCWNVDLPLSGASAESERLIEDLIAEFDAKLVDPVVAYRGDHRWVQSFEALRLEERSVSKTRIREGGVYLITGGMGGLGLEFADWLARQARAKIVLIGRSPFPDRQDWSEWIRVRGEQDEVSRKIRRLLAMEEAGAEILTLRADVANPEQMREAIRQIQARFGAVNGVIHSAGVPAGGLIQLKTPEMVESIFSPKVKGAMILDSLLGNHEPDFLLLCSSVASVVGVAGQVDYCAANAFLDGYAQYQARKKATLTISINWDAWAEVGMAVNAKKIWPGGPFERLNSNSHYQSSDHPLFDKQRLEDDECAYLTEFSTAKHWLLSEHVIMGHPTLVGTGWLEMARAAFEKQFPNNSIEIRDALFIQPLTVVDGEKKEVQTIIKRSGETFEFSIRSQSKTSENGGWQWLDHAVGKILVGDNGSRESFDIEGLIKRCQLKEASTVGHHDLEIPAEESNLQLEITFGGRWSKVKREIYFGQGEALARLELPEEYAYDLEKLHLHPSLMDIAVSYIIDLQAYLPFSYKKIKVFAPLSRRIYSYARRKDGDASSEVLKFDVTILNEEGVRLVEVEDCTFRKLGQHALQTLLDRGGSKAPQVTAAPRQNEGIADSDLEDAILPGEGVEVLRRILSMNLPPQVIVSTRHLMSQLRRANSAELQGAANDAKENKTEKLYYPRPHLKTAFVAPQNELEQTIAEIWQLVLGIDQIGVHDDFIDLGGHSLLAMQVISRIREAFQMDLPMDTIFKAPTVTELANVVVQTLAKQVDQELLRKLLAEMEDPSKAER